MTLPPVQMTIHEDGSRVHATVTVEGAEAVRVVMLALQVARVEVEIERVLVTPNEEEGK